MTLWALTIFWILWRFIFIVSMSSPRRFISASISWSSFNGPLSDSRIVDSESASLFCKRAGNSGFKYAADICKVVNEFAQGILLSVMCWIRTRLRISRSTTTDPTAELLLGLWAMYCFAMMAIQVQVEIICSKKQDAGTVKREGQFSSVTRNLETSTFLTGGINVGSQHQYSHLPTSFRSQ
jgi:hypothetical protein